MSTDSEQWLAKLYASASPIGLAVAQRIVGDRLESEDILQDAFVAALQLRNTYSRVRGSELSWLLAIVRGKALDRLRARKVRNLAAQGMRDASREEASAPDPMAEEHLRRGLAGLSLHQRAALDLSYFEGLTHVEIAARMQAPLGSVKTWLRSGLALLGASFLAVDEARGCGQVRT